MGAAKYTARVHLGALGIFVSKLNGFFLSLFIILSGTTEVRLAVKLCCQR